ncbi:MAG: DUF2264 domain-containing protein [Acidobacteriota bacterium]|nr:DUF2264 domain-containing protein [Acidobacteriota bacterium]
MARTVDGKLSEDRASWLELLDRICRPLFEALSQRRLKALMPVEAYAGEQEHRRQTTYLEALGRALCGIAPWLEHGATTGAEGEMRARYCEWARAAIASAVDKSSPDYMDFGGDRQTIVDTAFLSLAMLRAPQELREKLAPAVRAQLADAMRATRLKLPNYNNWLLFAAMIEAGLFALGEPWDRLRVDYALREHENWYVGDGVYGDGPHFHQDYYNSFVIQPFLEMLMDVMSKQEDAWGAMAADIRERGKRYAAIQERMIAPDGSYPVVGRSIAYRCGAFQQLADVALRHALPEAVSPEQVRGALTAVMQRTLTPAGTFDEKGWLRIGLAGHQPSLGEVYISTGSLYLCMTAFLPLGLPAADRFWSGAAAPWSSVTVWGGADFAVDHALEGRQRGD